MADDDRSLTPFSEWVADHARGTVDDEMTAALAEVVQAVTHLDAKGKVTLELQIEPAGSGGRTVVVAGKVTARPPLPDPEVSIFYADGDGGLHRDDPYQTRAFDPDTETAPTLPTNINPETGEITP